MGEVGPHRAGRLGRHRPGGSRVGGTDSRTNNVVSSNDSISGSMLPSSSNVFDGRPLVQERYGQIGRCSWLGLVQIHSPATRHQYHRPATGAHAAHMQHAIERCRPGHRAGLRIPALQHRVPTVRASGQQRREIRSRECIADIENCRAGLRIQQRDRPIVVSHQHRLRVRSTPRRRPCHGHGGDQDRRGRSDADRPPTTEALRHRPRCLNRLHRRFDQPLCSHHVLLH